MPRRTTDKGLVTMSGDNEAGGLVTQSSLAGILVFLGGFAQKKPVRKKAGKKKIEKNV